ncbi:MAG: hypothetical protein OXE03_12420, partial [Gammaproteobacteria bacterium]|nr:hypothetical protein [Gammaproteobacteria bacterium]
TGATIATDEATGTITDDDAAPTALTLTVDADTGTEGVQDSLAEDGGVKTVRVTATLGGTSTFTTATTVTVAVGTSDDSATEATDYETVTDQIITIPAGQSSAHVDFTLTPKQDILAEGDESIALEGTATGLDVTDTEITLTDDDGAPTVALSLSPATIDESGKTNISTVTATLSGAISEALTLTVAAGAGVTLSANKVLAIAAGQTASTGTVMLTAIDNDIDAADLKVTISATVTGASGIAAPAAQTLTVTDDDTATLSIADATAAEGSTATFKVTLSTPSAQAVTVTATTSEGTATDPEDYTHKTETLTFAAGETSKDFTVAIANDTEAELDETFSVTLSAASGATITDATAIGTITGATATGTITGTIIDDDEEEEEIITPPTPPTTPAVSIRGGPAVTEGEHAVFTLTVSPPPTTALSVNLSVGQRGRFVAQSRLGRLIVLVPTSGRLNYRVPTQNDGEDEPNGAVRVSLQSGAGYDVADAPADTATVTVRDNDVNRPPPQEPAQLSVGPATAVEGNPVVFTLNISRPLKKPIELLYSTEDRTAQAGQDYTGAEAVLFTIPPMTTSAQLRIMTTDDALIEDTELFTLALSLAGNDAIPPARITGIIKDNDDVGISVQDAEVQEGAVLRFPVALSAVSETNDVSVSWSLAAGTATADVDYVNDSGVLTIPAGKQGGTITVTTVQDRLDEPDETLTLTLSAPRHAVLSVSSATGTIADDDKTPTLRVADAVAEEGDVLEFQVSMDGASAQSVSVNWSLVAGTATAGVDYVNDSGVLTIPAETQGGTITVVTVQDSLAEMNETLTLELTAPRHAVLSMSVATGTIEDEDALPPLSVNDAETMEGGTLEFEVSMAGTAGRDVSVNWSISPGSASPGRDYEADSGALSIPAGADRGMIMISTIQDDLDEPDETLFLTLSSNMETPRGPAARSYLRMERDRATGMIIDDDETPQLSGEDAAPVSEGGLLVFRLYLSTASMLPASVDWRTGGGTASADVDYQSAYGTLQIPAGETVAEIVVQTLDDAVPEDEETVMLSLVGNEYVQLEVSELTGRILDDDQQTAARLQEVNKAALPQVTAALAHTRITQLDECLQGAGGSADFGAALGALVQRLPQSSAVLQDDDRSVWERFGGSRFRHTLRAAAEDEEGAGDAGGESGIEDVTLCGGLDWRRLADDRRGVGWEGSLYGGYLSGHLRFANDLVAGVSVSQSFVDIGYEAGTAQTQGDWELSLTGVQPYLARSWSEGGRLWVMAGWGAGELTLQEAGLPASATSTDNHQDTDVKQWQSALGGALPLKWGAGAAGRWQRGIDLKGSAWWSRMEIEANESLLYGVSADIHGLRALLDTHVSRRFDSGAGLTLNSGAGLRYDGNAGGAGLEWVGGFSYTGAGSRLQTQLNARSLLLRGATKEWGLSAHAKLAPRADGSGFSFAMAPAWGEVQSAFDSLWDGDLTGYDRQQGTGFAPLSGGGRSGATFEAELGYGFRLPWQRGLITPTSAYRVAPLGREMELGLRWTWRPGLELELDWQYREQGAESDPITGLFLKFIIGPRNH